MENKPIALRVVAQVARSRGTVKCDCKPDSYWFTSIASARYALCPLERAPSSELIYMLSLVLARNEMLFLALILYPLIANFLEFVKYALNCSRMGKSSMGPPPRNARLQLLIVLLAAFALEAHARPDFDLARAGSELRRSRPPHSQKEPLRFKQSLREHSPNGNIVHLSYDVTRLNSTRVLDEMEPVDGVRCSPDNTLTIILAPGYIAEDVVSEFLPNAVVNGGSEWNCSWVSGQDPGPFSRRILGVSVIGTDIVMNTSECSPFESFANEDIELFAVIGQPLNDTSQVDDHGLGADTRCCDTQISAEEEEDGKRRRKRTRTKRRRRRRREGEGSLLYSKIL